MLRQFSRRRRACRRSGHVLTRLSRVRGVNRVMSVHWVTWRRVGVTHSLRRAAENVSLSVRLYVIPGLCVDDARGVKEARMLLRPVVWVHFATAIGWCWRVHWNCVHRRHGSWRRVWRRWSHAVGCGSVRRARHGPASDSRRGLGLVDSRLRVHVLGWSNVSQLRVVGRLWEIVRVGAGVVADEMEVLATGRCDTERLLHETVWLVAVAIWAFAVRVASCGAVRRLAARPLDQWWCWRCASSLALHFSVGQEAARHSARTPRLAVCPSPHAGLALVPHEH